jgi:hypothetical protein
MAFSVADQCPGIAAIQRDGISIIRQSGKILPLHDRAAPDQPGL